METRTMHAIDLLHTIEELSPEAQHQVISFIEFIKKNQPQYAQKNTSTAYGFGAIHVQKKATLAQMDDAIKQSAAQ